MYYGRSRRDLDDISSYDIVITTYDTLMSDRNREEQIYEIEWARLVLDEGKIYIKTTAAGERLIYYWQHSSQDKKSRHEEF
jgi:SNF2 family DNA or RNA helicase